MKPLYLEIQAFGPYAEKQTIDFEALSEKGIFLIKGKTGSGKTTIFDAMMIALYGVSSGEPVSDKQKESSSGRNVFSDWRCTQADKTLDTYVSFTFSAHGRKYVFKRILEPKKVNLKEKLEAGEIDSKGNIIPFFDNPKQKELNEKAVELTGLTPEQFRQVIMLPQGKFEKFLTASSEIKESLLKKIFSNDQWERYASAFYSKAEERKKSLCNEKNNVLTALKEYDCFDEDLHIALANLENSIKNNTESLKNVVKEKEEYDAKSKQEELSEDIKLAEAFKPYHKFMDRLKNLEAKSDEFNEKRESLKNSEKADSLRTFIEKYDEKEKEYKDRVNALNELNDKLPDAKLNKKNAENSLKIHKDNSPVENLQLKKAEYESKKSVYSGFEKVKSTYENAEKNLNAAFKELNDAEKKSKSALEVAKKYYKEYDNASQEASEIRKKYYLGIYGEIAESLVEGEKCPVCGSLSHPSPAKKTPDSVNKDDMEKAEQKVEKLKEQWQGKDKLREEADKDKKEKEKLKDEVNRIFIQSESDFNNAQKQLDPKIKSEKDLKFAISKIKKEIENYDAKTEKLQAELDKFSSALDTLNAEIKSAGKEEKASLKLLDKAKTKLEEQLAEKGYSLSDTDKIKTAFISKDDLNSLREEINNYDNDIKTTQKYLDAEKNKLKGKTEPDAEKFEERQKEITEKTKWFNGQEKLLNDKISTLKKKYDEFSVTAKNYFDNITQAESDLQFAKRLRGDTGTGIQRYVLAIMFNEVIAEANRMLNNVHGGRYHLFRTDDKGSGNKRGLELKVYDSRSPENKEGRFVSMLSGGEKFLVSLALSIGMSTIAQKSGVQTEALFIDEGFGTLDNTSIQDAMDILDSVRKGSGMIGIISHVSLLESTIPTHLEVVKSEAGSSVRVL